MIETGDRNPTLGLAKKIAEFFQVNIEDIFFDDLGNEALRDAAWFGFTTVGLWALAGIKKREIETRNDKEEI